MQDETISLPIITISKQNCIEKRNIELCVDYPKHLAVKNISALHLSFAARQRCSNAKVKKMSEISGTTAKPWKQKGSGRARQGSRRSVQFVGGRTCHGPSMANFSYRLPKKVSKSALLDAIKIKLLSGNVAMLEIVGNFNSKTSVISNALKSCGYNNGSAMIVTNSDALRIASKNIKGAIVQSPKSIKIFEVLKSNVVIIDKDSYNSGSILDHFKLMI